jgi:ketosteroid isomerase-like protein
MAGAAERVQELFALWNAGDREAWLAGWHEECEWVSAVTSSVDGSRVVYSGRDELERFWEDNHEAWERFEVEAMNADDLGEGLVLASGRVRARGLRSGVELDSPLHFVFRLTQGQVLRASAYLDREGSFEALRAEGVAEETIWRHACGGHSDTG